MPPPLTLPELARIGAKAANAVLSAGSYTLHSAFSDPNQENARLHFTKAILDAIGYELPKDEEREAFERWASQYVNLPDDPTLLTVWKAGREALRKTLAEAEEEPTQDMHPEIGGNGRLSRD